MYEAGLMAARTQLYVFTAWTNMYNMDSLGIQ